MASLPTPPPYVNIVGDPPSYDEIIDTSPVNYPTGTETPNHVVWEAFNFDTNPRSHAPFDLQGLNARTSLLLRVLRHEAGISRDRDLSSIELVDNFGERGYESYLLLSIFTGFCCNPIIGLVACLFSLLSINALEKGDISSAKRRAFVSYCLSVFGIVITVLSIIFALAATAHLIRQKLWDIYGSKRNLTNMMDHRMIMRPDGLYK